MTWRDQLRDASFRGAAFQVEASDSAHGRRTALHEYPLRDKPFSEDLGRKSRQINLEAIVIGDNYMGARDALISALEQPGLGRLVHPYFGEMQVSVADYGHVRESTKEGGMARITLAFVESGDVIYPSSTTDTSTATNNAADAASTTAVDSFAGGFTISGLPAFASLSALGTITEALGQVRALARFPLGDILGRGILEGLIGALDDGASSMLNAPSTLGQSIFDVVTALRTTAPDAATAVAPLVALAAFTPAQTLPVPFTSTRVTEAANRAAIVALVRTAAITEAARAIADMDFDSYDQAQAVLGTVLAPIDTLLDATTDDTVYAAVNTLRATVARDVATRGANLARIVRYTPPATLPALVIAYGLYEDPERDVDILTRNNIARPGFVPSGQSIEVPIDA